MFSQFLRRLHQLEDMVLTGMFLLMLLLSVAQIVARNFGVAGLVWGDELARVLVLWVGLLGAMAAARTDKHLRIDLFTRLLKPVTRKFVVLTAQVGTALVSVVAAYGALTFVMDEYSYGSIAFAGVPTWVTMSVIPFALGVLALRYLVLAILTILTSATEIGR